MLFLEESQDSVLLKLMPSLVIIGADDLNLQGWSWSHKQESLCFAKIKERRSPRSRSYHVVVVVSFLQVGSNRMLVV